MKWLSPHSAPIFAGFVCTLFCALFSDSLAAERTSENDERLKRALARFPAADANGDKVLTQTEAQAFFRKRRQQQGDRQRPARPPRPEPTHADVPYGPHERNVLDLWLAESAEATPLVIYIHGGGFRSGDKQGVSPGVINGYRQTGISVAAINYRLTDDGKHPFPIPMHDGARALQYLRLHAEKYNLDKERVACIGGSAGACMSMWLAMHDDLADPDSDDPVLRESTRISVAGPSGGQSTLDMKTFEEWFGVKPMTEHPAMRPLFGMSADDTADTPRVRKLMIEASPITHLTKDDPPVFASYGGGDVLVDENSSPGLWVHHPRLGLKLQEAMNKLGLECHVQYRGGPPIKDGLKQSEFIIQQLKK